MRGFEAVFKELRPNKWAINEDALEISKKKELAGKHVIELVILKHNRPKEFEEISTGKLIKKIKSKESYS